MTSSPMSTAQANFKMALLQADADSTSNNDLFILLNDIGLPVEVSLRLKDLMSYTKKVAGKVFAVGKIILIKIIEFVKAHPFLVLGAGICAAIGSVIVSLAGSIPFLSVVLTPLAQALGIVLTVAGTLIGNSLDKAFPNIGRDIEEIAKMFFKWLVVFKAIFREVTMA